MCSRHENNVQMVVKPDPAQVFDMWVKQVHQKLREQVHKNLSRIDPGVRKTRAMGSKANE